MKKITSFFAVLLICTVAFAQEKTEGVHIYNPEANAMADLKEATQKAAKANKHVLVQVGGNWCTWCIAFHNLVNNTPSLKQTINDNYEFVLVNWDKDHHNDEAMKYLGYPNRFGYPVFVVLDGKGKVLHIENSAYLETDEVGANGKKQVGHDVKKTISFLKGWTVTAVNPETYKTK
ncbi:thioredoxin family protein [Pedobacter sandarakinus]|uniref:thioredoxin family protein n=1 Tax=Pedobacter sandarakinus TaxID=353156 RepID=UPI0022452732|nr:thioredoxin family protein [Pedobacter sandarakinus]MCX2576137.1 thioredoxin family protein [Pedobacter sandarakinus]